MFGSLDDLQLDRVNVVQIVFRVKQVLQVRVRVAFGQVGVVWVQVVGVWTGTPFGGHPTTVNLVVRLKRRSPSATVNVVFAFKLAVAQVVINQIFVLVILFILGVDVPLGI
mgnify:CR=1 FL=1